MLMGFLIFLEDGDEKALNSESLTQCGCQIYAIATEQLKFISIIFRLLTTHNPSHEQ